MKTALKDRDYAVLEPYLRAVVELLEGGADVEEAFATLQDYLSGHRPRDLSPELEDLLLRLFFFKCRKEFSTED